MRALVRREGTVQVQERPGIDPGNGELCIGTEVAGLCGTDIQMLRGLRDDPAPVIGHEGIGRVVATGPGVPEHLAVGTLVAVNPTHPRDPSFLLGHTVDGLLQERTLIAATAVDGGLVLPLPARTDPGLGAILEPLAVVRYALSQLTSSEPGVLPGTLIVIGDGIVGHLAVRAAARWLGPQMRIVLVHHTVAGREHAEATGTPANEFIDAAALSKLQWDQGGAAALIVTPRTGTLEALENLLTAAEHNPGPVTVDIVGGLPSGACTPMLAGADLTAIRAANCAGESNPARSSRLRTPHGRLVTVFGHRGVSNGHLLDAATELARDPERYRPVITHETDLDGAARVMRSLIDSPERLVDGRRLLKLAVRIRPQTTPNPQQNQKES